MAARENEMREDCKVNFDALFREIRGNGSPEHGLLMRMKEVERVQRWALRLAIGTFSMVATIFVGVVTQWIKVKLGF